MTFDAKVGSGDTVTVHMSEAGDLINVDRILTNTSFETFTLYIQAGNVSTCYIRAISMETGEEIWFDNLKLQEVGGNAGALQNFQLADWQGDTP